MFLKQLQVGHMAIFAYIVGDKETGDALVIDPAAETERIVAEAQKNNLTIRYIVNTHGHVDHISGNADMKKIAAGQMDPTGRDLTNAGRICGMIVTILMIVATVLGLMAAIFVPLIAHMRVH